MFGPEAVAEGDSNPQHALKRVALSRVGILLDLCCFQAVFRHCKSLYPELYLEAPEEFNVRENHRTIPGCSCT